MEKNQIQKVRNIIYRAFHKHQHLPPLAYVDSRNKDRPHKVQARLLGEGSYGQVFDVCVSNVQGRNGKPHNLCVVLKKQKENDEFRTEVRVLKRLQARTDLAFKPVIYTSFHIRHRPQVPGTGIMLLPKLDGSLFDFPSKKMKDIVGVISQQIYTLHYIHSATKIKHCDSHLGNWLYKKQRAPRVYLKAPLRHYHTFPSDYTVYLYDPGLSHPVGGKQKRKECESVSYDYYRLFSSHAGWLRVQGLSKETYDFITALGQYILALNGIDQPASRDWENKFDPNIKSYQLARGLLTKISLLGKKPPTALTPTAKLSSKKSKAKTSHPFFGITLGSSSSSKSKVSETK